MKKKGIICGVCAVALLLFLTPTIPAQQYTLVKDSMEKDFQQQLNRAITALRIMAEDDTQNNDQKDVVMDSFNEMKQILYLGGFGAEPACFKFIINTLLSLILAALGTLFGVVFGPLLALIVKVITTPAVLLANILAFLFGGNKAIDV